MTNISKSFYLQESTGIDMEQNYVTVGPMYSINFFFVFVSVFVSETHSGTARHDGSARGQSFGEALGSVYTLHMTAALRPHTLDCRLL